MMDEGATTATQQDDEPSKADHKLTEPTPESMPDELAGATFNKTCIVGQSLTELFDLLESVESKGPDDQARIVDLAVLLDGLRTAEDAFLPSKIYVRNCMQTIFGYFKGDVLTGNGNRVLLGSPGVGKSVLFFIAALEKALNGDKPVVYLRNTREEKKTSIFIMARASGSLNIFSHRNITDDQYDSLRGCKGMRTTMTKLFRMGSWDNCVFFLDGPRHNAEGGTLNKTYDYFCTSGGHPLPKNAETDVYLWILDGWSEDDAIQALNLLNDGQEAKQAAEAYSVCGGCIRDMVRYVSSEQVADSIKALLKSLADRMGRKRVAIALTSMERENDDDGQSPDRLRTMFNGKGNVPYRIPVSIQVVTSAEVVRCLRGRLALEVYLEALNLGQQIKSGPVVGIFFEEILQKWFVESPPPGVTGCYEMKEGLTGAEGVEMLRKAGVYWSPSIPNFANIDGAVIVRSVLCAFQYTKSATHGFNKETFWMQFASQVRKNVTFTHVHVYFVAMKGVLFHAPDVSFKKYWKDAKLEQVSTRKDTLQAIKCTYSTVFIDCETVKSVRQSAAKAFSQLGVQNAGGHIISDDDDRDS